MKQQSHDLIVIGGGIAGAAFARSMALSGSSVLLLEREPRFRERLRGEGMHPWGVEEARRLGIYDRLLAGCGHHPRWWQIYDAGVPIRARDLAATNPYGVSELTFYHPEMQETVFQLAMESPAEVHRGVQVRSVSFGERPSVVFEDAAQRVEASARLIVGADGSSSMVAKAAGFGVQADPDRLYLAGALIESDVVPEDRVHVFPGTGGMSLWFPLGRNRVRAYGVYQTGDGVKGPFTGDRRKPKFLQFLAAQKVPAEWLTDVKFASPLAQFPAAHHWVDSPAKQGVVLIGDAAAKPDPTHGCGMSLALRDARVLSQCLRSDKNWSVAVMTCAAEHDRYHQALHRLETWFTGFLWDRGPEADARRAQFSPEMARTGLPDTVGLGPESAMPEAF
jgi:menaquinone-9 beta-reductase